MLGSTDRAPSVKLLMLTGTLGMGLVVAVIILRPDIDEADDKILGEGLPCPKRDQCGRGGGAGGQTLQDVSARQRKMAGHLDPLCEHTAEQDESQDTCQGVWSRPLRGQPGIQIDRSTPYRDRRAGTFRPSGRRSAQPYRRA